MRSIGIAWIVLVVGCWSGKPAAPPQPTNRVAAPAIREGVQYVGNAKASVVLTYYFDYECPPCVAFSPRLDELARRYGDRIVIHFKNFQLAHHKTARLAGIAAEAARRQGKFIEMYRRLIDHAHAMKDPAINASIAAMGQGSPGGPPPTFTSENVRQFAAELRLDLGRFDRDMADPAAGARVDGEMDEGSRRGVDAVPMIYLGDEPHQGGGMLDGLTAAIDAKLSP